MRPGSNGNPGVNNNGSGMMMNHHPHHHGFPGAYNPGGAPGSQPNPNNNNNNVSVGGNTMMMMNSGMGGGGGPPQHHVNSPSSTGNNSNSASYHMNGAGIPASGPVTVNNQHQPPGGSPKQCAGCGVRIQDRFLLLAMDRYWHTGCLKCSCCQAQLGEIGTSCFTKAGMILCRNDYIRLFGSGGSCYGCGQPIPASEMVMRAQTSVYHLKCFTCCTCHSPLNTGDRYGIVQGSLVCEQDFPKVVKGLTPLPNRTSHKSDRSPQFCCREPIGARQTQTVRRELKYACVKSKYGESREIFNIETRRSRWTDS
ncbi:hypothetical protein RRG08_060064 [Elysia crispata]|uniref:LIM zinc-binding domain-containing protein n=1 Tax=Elysia crispata TaxID=231223 RepID=A0AAE0Y0N7_9GAST|nr:hypothetical protein RRG08_060064 [Elysia crispata]